MAELDRRGLPHWPATGRDPDRAHHEEGVAVPGLTEAEGIALGRSYGQAAVYVWTPDGVGGGVVHGRPAPRPRLADHAVGRA